jgi:hypothetical protein
MGGVKYVVPVFRWLRRLKLTTFIFQSSRFDLTLKRRGPIGGAAYGTPSKAKKVLFSKVTASRPLIWPLGSCNTISASYGSQFWSCCTTFGSLQNLTKSLTCDRVARASKTFRHILLR